MKILFLIVFVTAILFAIKIAAYKRKSGVINCNPAYCIYNQKQRINEKIFNQELFDFFVNNHNLTLLQGEINDIKFAVYNELLNDLQMFSDEKLDDVFHGVIAEINRRKAEKQNVDVGFWDSSGVYVEDIQPVDEKDDLTII